ncbi:Asp23/Gls24 family envelope stress response protein [Streptomyces erythrochromogenes]|uniref:Asp23/Gls24 family envelope stress response protein n=1 Tax=Streptomyces erythrochromogenes TaxID=285574 RepID=A0ABZ1Q4Y0_9ACTN|nr:Asp23/Gls24 family envelope stress response protein [Streptomyces erythrochromogenes]MCX5583416.1 Asp23/Gls24 family envelope stress response protein [Streptomyces erythrochromogenes]
MAMNHPERFVPPEERPGEEHAELLACGRDLAAVWEQTERTGGTERTGQAPADPHTLRCPHCREAVADLERLRTAAVAPTTAAAGGPADPSALVRRVMDAVRLEPRPGRALPLGGADEDARVHESVAARTLRTAAEEVPGVRAGSCRIAPPGGRGEQARGPVTVRLEVTVEYGHDLRATSEAVRRTAVRAAHERLGLTVSALDVTVTDLHDPPHRPQGAAP